jgi:hypothetical protein
MCNNDTYDDFNQEQDKGIVNSTGISNSSPSLTT